MKTALFSIYILLLRCTRGNPMGETYKLLSRLNSPYGLRETARRIVTMTPNKLIVYFVADKVLADMVVADMVCGRYGRTPSPTVSSRGQTTVILCSTFTIA